MDNSEPAAIIKYCIGKDGVFSIDVDIDDFDISSIENLATLFSSIPTDAFSAQAMLIIKDAFIDHGQELAFTTFLASTILKKKEMDDEEQEGETRDNDDPIIKPTDLL